ncbi:hypothetical protein WN51_10440 [Melipona quadrifasciata]|uniref:Uncharacterized protein n=1 Tax=Melipona quadrifasciata TaxID=166423 RepID=A0A0M9A5S6_9HYME|nr:hypothetical protein WN51_10440 [Melipona quadrifasciata]
MDVGFVKKKRKKEEEKRKRKVSFQEVSQTKIKILSQLCRHLLKPSHLVGYVTHKFKNHTKQFTIPVDYSTAYSPAGSSAGRSWVAAVARSPWDVPSREYREHRPEDDVAADDEGSVCRLRSRFRCRGAVCGVSACEDDSRSSRDLGGTNEDWKPRQEEEADTCSTSVDAPPSAAAVVVVAEQRKKMAVVAVADEKKNTYSEINGYTFLHARAQKIVMK